MTNPANAAELLGKPLHHLGYVVDDVHAAAAYWSQTFGIGPFILFEHMVFDSVIYDGAPATFDHSAAFGRWGPLYIELQQLHEVRPNSFRRKLSPFSATSLNHVAVPVDDPAAESDRLEALGARKYLHAVIGDVVVRWHDTTAQLGFSVEIHQAGPGFSGLFDIVDKEAHRWDGVTAIKPASF